MKRKMIVLVVGALLLLSGFAFLFTTTANGEINRTAVENKLNEKNSSVNKTQNPDLPVSNEGGIQANKSLIVEHPLLQSSSKPKDYISNQYGFFGGNMSHRTHSKRDMKDNNVGAEWINGYRHKVNKEYIYSEASKKLQKYDNLIGEFKNLGVSFSIGGNITVNTTWSGLVNVTSNVTVKAGITLTINAGTVIRFNKSAGLYVDGNLVASGSDGNDIIFEPNTTSPSTGFWKGIIINSTSTSSVLSYVNISYAENSLLLNLATATVSHSIFWNDENGTYINWGLDSSTKNLSLNITDCNIMNNTNYGIIGIIQAAGNTAPANFVSDINITGNHITGNGQDGIAIMLNATGNKKAEISFGLNIANNNVSYNGKEGISFISRPYSGNAVASINTTFNIVQNDIYYNAGGGFFAVNNPYQEGSYAYANMTGNVSSNTANSNDEGLSFYSESIQNSGGTAYSNMTVGVWNNELRNNTQNGIEVYSLTNASTQPAYSNLTCSVVSNGMVYNHIAGINLVAGDSSIQTAILDAMVENNNLANNALYGINATNVHLTAGNNTVVKNGKEIGGSTKTALSEDFSGTFPPAGWTTQGDSNHHWKQSNSNNAGGTSPEADFYWSPQEVIQDWLISKQIDTLGYTSGTLTFKTYVHWYTSSFNLYVKTYDGTNWHTVWQKTITSNYGPTTISIPLDTSVGIGSSSFKIAFEFSGNTWNIWDWYIDDVNLILGGGNAGMGIRMASNTVASLCNNVVSGNSGYGIYTDSSSTANLYVNNYGEVHNNDISINGNVTVAPYAKLSLYNLTANIWNVEDNGLMEIGNASHTVISHNVTVNGLLYVNSTTWKIASNYNGQYHINVTSTGHMVIQDNGSGPSIITSEITDSAHNYEFWVQDGGDLGIYSSEIHYCGWNNWNGNWTHAGLWIDSNNVDINNSVLSNNYDGMVIYAKNPKIENSTITNNNANGISILNGSGTIRRNKISSNQWDGIWMWNANLPLIVDNNMQFSSSGVGVGGGNSSAMVYSNNITSNWRGIYFEYAHTMFINENNITGNSDGIDIYTAMEQVTVQSNNITTNNGEGISIYGEANVSLSNNTVHSNSDNGILIESNTERTAGIRYRGAYNLTYLPFGFETINGVSNRNQLMSNLLNWFGAPSKILLVDDDGGANYEIYYNASLNAAGYQPASSGASHVYYYWDTSKYGTPNATVLENNGTVIWFTGYTTDTLNKNERDNLTIFLNHGGNLFISGENIGYDASINGWNSWYNEWLRADFIDYNSGVYDISGLGGAISDDLSFSIMSYNGDGADYPLWDATPEAISAIRNSQPIFIYNDLVKSSVYQNNISMNSKDGIQISYANPSIYDNSILNNGRDGIYWHAANLNAVIHDNTINDNTNEGIYLWADKNLSVLNSNIYYNKINLNGDNGIYAGANGSVSMSLNKNNNVVNSNIKNGIYSYSGMDTILDIQQRLLFNNEDGLHIYSKLNITGEINHSNVSENKYNGTFLYSLSGNIDVSMGYDIMVNDTNGWGIYTSAQNGTLKLNLDNNFISQNNNGGIGVYDYGGDIIGVTLTSDKIVSNGGNGIHVSGEYNATVILTSNQLSENSNDGIYAYTNNGNITISSSMNDIVGNGNDGIYLYSNLWYVTGSMADDSVTSNTNDGAEIYSSNALSLNRETMSANKNNGLVLYDGKNTKISNSFFNDNRNDGLSVDSCTSGDVKVSNTVLNENWNNGLYIYNSNPVIYNNRILDNGNVSSQSYSMSNGIYIQSSNNPVISENEIQNNVNNGISIYQSLNVVSEDNDIRENYLGIYSYASSSTVGNNTIVYNLGSSSRNGGGGIWVVHGSTMTVYNNIISYNLMYGIYTDNSSSTNWFINKIAKAKSNTIILRGNIEVLQGGNLSLYDIKGTYPDGMGLGVYIRAERNNQFSIVVEQGGYMNIENTKISSYTSDSYKFTVDGGLYMSGGTVEMAYVLDIYSSDVKITGSVIREGWSGGIAIHDGSPIVERTSIVDNTYYGLYIYNSKPVLRSLNITGNREGIVLDGTTIELNNIVLEDNDIGIKADGSNFYLYNSTLSNHANDLYLDNNSMGWLLNTHFDEESPVVLDTSIIKVNWFCNVKVLDSQEKVVSGVNVTLRDSFGTISANKITDLTGYAKWIVVLEYEETSSGKKYYSPYNITATVDGLNYSVIETLNNSKTVVIKSNFMPVISSTPVIIATEGKEYYYNVLAYDPDGNTLVYSLLKMPAGMTIDPVTGEITWLPSGSEVGNNTVIVEVKDGNGGYAIQRFNITVKSVNHAPQLCNISASPTGGDSKNKYIFTVTYKDEDNDTPAHVYIIIDGVKKEMSRIAGDNYTTGVVYQYAGYISAGAHSYVFEAIDTEGGKVITPGYTIYVQQPPIPPDHTWDYLVAILLIVLIALVILDIYFWKYRKPKDIRDEEINEEKKEEIEQGEPAYSETEDLGEENLEEDDLENL